MSDREIVAQRFEAARSRLEANAYRLLGSRAEAQDVVQEAWLRLDRSNPSHIDDLDAWLTTVVARICLDVMGSSRWRRERAWQVEAWPDEPESSAADPFEEAEQGEAVALALQILLDALTPAERMAFVLHDLFGRSFDDVAVALERSPMAARQLASRGRRRLRDHAAEGVRSRAHERRIVDAWLLATEEGDLGALLTLLADDAVLAADYGTSTTALRGRRNIARKAVLASRLAAGSTPARIGGRPGVVAEVAGRVVSIVAFTIENDVITRLEIVADPARITSLAGLSLAGSAHRQVT